MIVDIHIAQEVIILVNFNGSKDTIECINSINKSTVDVAIIVVDNGSTEDEFQKLKIYEKDITLIKSNVNVGFAAGNNIAIKLVLEHYKNINNIILLNNDTVIDQQMIEKLRNRNNGKSITVPKMMYYDEPDVIWYGGGVFNRWTGRAIHVGINKRDGEYKDSLTCDFATGCCMFIPTEVCKKLGCFDESYFMYCEDTEYCLRAKYSGVDIKYVPEAVLYHKLGRSSGGGESPFSLYYMTRNRLRYLNDYKDMFFFTAKVFTICSRLFRIFQFCLKRDDKSTAIWLGMVDYHKGVIGRSRF